MQVYNSKYFKIVNFLTLLLFYLFNHFLILMSQASYIIQSVQPKVIYLSGFNIFIGVYYKQFIILVWFTCFPFRFGRVCTVAFWAKETLWISYRICWRCPGWSLYVSCACVHQALQNENHTSCQQKDTVRRI